MTNIVNRRFSELNEIVRLWEMPWPNSWPCTVRTSRQMSWNQRVGCLMGLNTHTRLSVLHCNLKRWVFSRCRGDDLYPKRHRAPKWSILCFHLNCRLIVNTLAKFSYFLKQLEVTPLETSREPWDGRGGGEKSTLHF